MADTDEALKQIRVVLSDARLRPYLRAVNDDLTKALRIYELNIQLCEALYPSLHTFEITFRNRLDNVLTNKYGENWYDGLTLHLENYEFQTFNNTREQIKKDIENNKRKNRPLTRNTLIAELSLGFWTGLICKKFYSTSIFNQCIQYIFPYADSSERDFANIAPPFKKQILHLRNRVFHHEPIWSKDYKVNEKHDYICDVQRWISPEVFEWLKSYDNFPKIYKNVSQQLSELIKSP